MFVTDADFSDTDRNANFSVLKEDVQASDHLRYTFGVSIQQYGAHRERKNIKPGMTVAIVLKQDQRTGKHTTGVVKDLLTNSANHPHGIKVRLTDGRVGRVQEIIEDKINSS